MKMLFEFCALMITGVVVLVTAFFWKTRDAMRTIHKVHFPRKRDLEKGDGFLLFAVGTRGDVQPMIAVGLELKTRGFPVCICTLNQFKPLVESFELTFASCGLESLNDQEAGWLLARSEAEFLGVVADAYLPRLEGMGCALLAACNTHTPICILTGMYGLHVALDVAEACRTKIRAIKYMPDAVTRFYPPFGMQPSRYERMNLVLHWRRLLRMVLAARKCGFTDIQNSFRRNVLNLPPITRERLEAAGRYLPTIYAYSGALIPRPHDWATWHRVFGFFFTPSLPATRLTKDLELFIRKSESIPLVVVTFGSMNSLRAADCQVVPNACRAALSLGLRVILITSWTEMDPNVLKSKDLFVVESVPHELLFPRCDLVIHHGGAGTVARVAQAAVPSVIIPVLKWYDQQGWAMAVERFGAGVHVENLYICEPELERIINHVVCDPVHRVLFKDRAQDLSRKLFVEANATKDAVDWLTSPLSPVEYDSRFNTDAIARMVQRSCLYH